VTIGTILGTIGVVLVVVAIGMLIDRKYSLLPKPEELAAEAKPPGRPPPSYAAGEAPSTAIRARDSQLAKLRAQRCTACRAEMRNDADDTVRYNDRDLVVLHFTCPACATRRVLYVERLG
jgi:hypothetical protein